MRTKRIQKVLLMFLLIFGMWVVRFIFIYFSYFLADYEYERIIKLNPKSRKEVESILFLYTSKPINIEASLWGKGTVLNEGDYCYQYIILFIQPIDIVYDKDGFVKHIFSSYE